MTSLASELYRTEMADRWAANSEKDVDLRTSGAIERIADGYRESQPKEEKYNLNKK